MICFSAISVQFFRNYCFLFYCYLAISCAISLHKSYFSSPSLSCLLSSSFTPKLILCLSLYLNYTSHPLPPPAHIHTHSPTIFSYLTSKRSKSKKMMITISNLFLFHSGSFCTAKSSAFLIIETNRRGKSSTKYEKF
jgi:hypothetical protein